VFCLPGENVSDQNTEHLNGKSHSLQEKKGLNIIVVYEQQWAEVCPYPKVNFAKVFF
jgi:hypothetical protein